MKYDPIYQAGISHRRLSSRAKPVDARDWRIHLFQHRGVSDDAARTSPRRAFGGADNFPDTGSGLACLGPECGTAAKCRAHVYLDQSWGQISSFISVARSAKAGRRFLSRIIMILLLTLCLDHRAERKEARSRGLFHQIHPSIQKDPVKVMCTRG
jgi:hypothetical protein